MTATDLALPDIRLGLIETWERWGPEREAMFATLRSEAPVSFHEEPVYQFDPENTYQGPGFWALTKYADVMHVSRHPELFSSAKGINIGDMPLEITEFFSSVIAMDAPRHTKLRLIVNRGFTPRHVAQLTDYVVARCTRIVDKIVEQGSCDVVTDLAAPMPLQIICDMLGIPESMEQEILNQTNVVLGVGDPEFVNSIEDLINAGMFLAGVGTDLAQFRRKNPTDDVTSALVNAEVDGEHITDQEFSSFFILLVVAGNETTRNAISHGVKALTDFPEQRAKWLADIPGVTPTAVEEIVRWSSPVIHMRRTANEDTVVGGQDIKAGEKLVMFYNSANRDEDFWDRPQAFDVTRSPNEHVGFGAGGPHFCLGANLARREIAIMFNELLTRVPDIHVTGDPEYLRSNFIHGIKRMPADFSAG